MSQKPTLGLFAQWCAEFTPSKGDATDDADTLNAIIREARRVCDENKITWQAYGDNEPADSEPAAEWMERDAEIAPEERQAAKHTPGTWDLQPDELTGGDTLAIFCVGKVPEHGERLADIVPRSYDGGYEPVDIANGTLMAKSPELLEAAIGVLESADYEADCYEGQAPVEIIKLDLLQRAVLGALGELPQQSSRHV